MEICVSSGDSSRHVTIDVLSPSRLEPPGLRPTRESMSSYRTRRVFVVMDLSPRSPSEAARCIIVPRCTEPRRHPKPFLVLLASSDSSSTSLLRSICMVPRKITLAQMLHRQVPR